MSGGIGTARATAGLPLVERIVKSQGEAFASMRDNDASFLMVANATSIIQWIVKMPSERVLASLLAHALAAAREATRGRPLMLDIGANAGYFGMMAAACGANVVLFEPQPACGAWINLQIAANHMGGQSHLVRAALAAAPPRPGERLSLAKDGTRLPPCAGHFDIAGRSDKADEASPLVHAAALREAAAAAMRTKPMPLPLPLSSPATAAPAALGATPTSGVEPLYADLISLWHGNHTWMPNVLRRALASTGLYHEHTTSADRTPRSTRAEHVAISFVKVDVNGAELGVLRENLLPLLQTRHIAHLVCEFTPLAWRRFNPSARLTDGAHLIHVIGGYGYRVSVLPKRRGHPPRPVNTSSAEAVLDSYLRENARAKQDADLHFERM